VRRDAGRNGRKAGARNPFRCREHKQGSQRRPPPDAADDPARSRPARSAGGHRSQRHHRCSPLVPGASTACGCDSSRSLVDLDSTATFRSKQAAKRTSCCRICRDRHPWETQGPDREGLPAARLSIHTASPSQQLVAHHQRQGDIFTAAGFAPGPPTPNLRPENSRRQPFGARACRQIGRPAAGLPDHDPEAWPPARGSGVHSWGGGVAEVLHGPGQKVTTASFKSFFFPPFPPPPTEDEVMATISDKHRARVERLASHSAFLHHDLDALIGVWSQRKRRIFEAAVAPFQTSIPDFSSASARKAAPARKPGDSHGPGQRACLPAHPAKESRLNAPSAVCAAAKHR